MAEGRTAIELGTFGVTPEMPMDAVMELLNEFRAKRVVDGVSDSLGTYLDELANGRKRDASAESLAGLAVEKRLAGTRNSGRTW